MHGMSSPYGKREVEEFLRPKLKVGMKICDIGAGNGTYQRALKGQYDWSAVEIWHETAEGLKKIYHHVYEMDMRDFDYPEDYDLVIFGDVLEHVSEEDAQECIRKARLHSKSILIAFPYYTKQGPLYGNEAERHIQDNCSPEHFDELYPGFERIYCHNNYAYYYWEQK